MPSKLHLTFTASLFAVGFVFDLFSTNRHAIDVSSHNVMNETDIVPETSTDSETIIVDSIESPSDRVLIDDNDDILTTTPSPIRSQIDAESDIFRTIRRTQCTEINQEHCVCDYVNLKGIRKSGTSWMINTLKRIREYFCEHKGLSNILSLCDKGHVAAYSRHPLVLPEDIDDHRLLAQFQNNRTLFLQELNQSRYCSVTVFRDPRDRWVSEAHWDARDLIQRWNDTKKTYDLVNDRIREWIRKQRLKESIGELNEYWNTFRNAEREDPSRFYNYFYEDMVLDTFDGMRNLVEFLGFYEVNDEDIHNLLEMSSHDTMKNEGININFRRGKVCGFYEELNQENADIVQQEAVKYLDVDLMEKFNLSCRI